MPDIRESSEGVLLEIKVSPSSGKNMISGVHNGRLKVIVSAPPEKSKANDALIKLLSSVLDIPKGSIEIKRGITSREKTVLIRNLSRETLTGILVTILRESG